jgi:hypothetical protein
MSVSRVGMDVNSLRYREAVQVIEAVGPATSKGYTHTIDF